LIKNKSIIRICEVSWNHLWTRRQRFSMMLAKNGNKVLYVEPAGSLLDFIIHPGRNVSLQIKAKIKKPYDDLDLYILLPSMRIPLAGTFSKLGLKFVKKYNQRSLKKDILFAISKLKMDGYFVWTYFQKSLSADLFNELKYDLLIYDCVDSIAQHPNTLDEEKLLEQYILQKAQIVFSTSRLLTDYLLKFNSNTNLFSNGVDIELYSKALDENTIIPSELKNIEGTVIGYVGVTYDLIRLDILEHIAKMRPQWTFIMIGPIHINLKRFKKYPNIKFLGVKKKEEIPNYLKRFDVCLNLFKETEFTKRINPLKVYEYLAAGKPVVSVPMIELEKFSSLIHLEKDKEKFLAKIELALNENKLENIEKRRETIKDYSWDIIFKRINDVVEREYAKR